MQRKNTENISIRQELKWLNERKYISLSLRVPRKMRANEDDHVEDTCINCRKEEIKLQIEDMVFAKLMETDERIDALPDRMFDKKNHRIIPNMRIDIQFY